MRVISPERLGRSREGADAGVESWLLALASSSGSETETEIRCVYAPRSLASDGFT